MNPIVVAKRAGLCLFCLISLGLPSLYARQPLPAPPTASQPRDEVVPEQQMSQMIEEDWLQALQGGITTQTDAAGGCDGVKNGKYGFHTGLDTKPWWQVDLGQAVPIRRVVVYNRLDYRPGLHNADNLQVLSSEDGQHWTLRYENRGQHFGGIEGAQPLELTFEPTEFVARFIRLQVPSSNPLFFHLDEVELYGPESDAKNLALGRPADQCSLSPWSTASTSGVVEFPTDACIERGRKLAADLRRAGVDVTGSLRELDVVEAESRALSSDSSVEQKRSIYVRARWIVRRLAFANPLLDFQQLLFVKRFCQETYPDICLNHMPWVSRPGGDICILENPFPSAGSGQQIRYLLDGALGPGHVHGLDLWFDGERVVFGYARAASHEPPKGWLDRRTHFDLRRQEEPIHLFEMDIDGRRLRQLTWGEWSDLDPSYAPSGDIIFVSERCGTSLQCNEYDKDETSCNLYAMRPDGTNIRRLSVSKDGDYLPHVLDDGSIVYTHWEYHERSWAYIQSLWTIRPDGTGANALFKQHLVDPWALEDARSIPGSSKLVAIAAGHHTLAAGPLVVIDTRMGPNTPEGIGIVTPGVKPPEGGMAGKPVPEGGVVDHRGYYSTPWALSEKYFLVSYAYGNRPLGKLGSEVDATGYALYLVDVFGNKELIYKDPTISCFTPIPLRSRPRPPILSDTIDRSVDYATCVVSDITFGSDQVQPEQVKFLRIAEPLGWPYDNKYGGHRYVEDHSFVKQSSEKKIPDESWTPIRILGDVPVSSDGSVEFRVPADTAVYFQLLDKDRMELQRMRSFISFRPGERRACVGCHETRGLTSYTGNLPSSYSLPSEPATMIPPPWGDRPISFLRDVQPVFDKHCLDCHSGLKPAQGLDFSGGLTSLDDGVPDYGYNRAYATLMTEGLIASSPARAQDASITPPLAYGSHRSRVIQAIADENHRDAVSLNAEEKLRLVMWIDANAPYHDRFVNKRAESEAYDLASDSVLHQSLLDIHARRCGACHQPDEVTRLDWIDIHHADQSQFLTAPLAESDGGRESCGPDVYVDKDDADYRAVLELVSQAVRETWARPRRDVQSLRPRGY
ncbi:MAG: discoidin domain-containing protein [Pirellulaceae bacterium]|nr:discoidin domain-containing protein [Pirellulaceae bacterium]